MTLDQIFSRFFKIFRGIKNKDMKESDSKSWGYLFYSFLIVLFFLIFIIVFNLINQKNKLPDVKNDDRPLRFYLILEPKSIQNGTQNESKFKTIFKREKVGLQEPLGAVLGRSWAILEAILGSKFALPY